MWVSPHVTCLLQAAAGCAGHVVQQGAGRSCSTGAIRLWQACRLARRLAFLSSGACCRVQLVGTERHASWHAASWACRGGAI